MAENRDIELRRCPTCGGLVGYAPEELSRIPTSAVYGVCFCPAPIVHSNGETTLDRLVHEFLTAVTYDVREFFEADGSVRSIRAVPRPLTLLIKGVKLKRVMPAEWSDVLGIPTTEIAELRWESQASLLLRAIEMMTAVIERNKRSGDPLTDDEIEQGATEYLALRHPELVAAHPEVFGPPKKKP